MKFNCGLTYAEKIAVKEQWHPYFCWWPTRIAHRDCRWLEWIERKGKFYCDWGSVGWMWEYRLPVRGKCRAKR